TAKQRYSVVVMRTGGPGPATHSLAVLHRRACEVWNLPFESRKIAGTPSLGGEDMEHFLKHHGVLKNHPRFPLRVYALADFCALFEDSHAEEVAQIKEGVTKAVASTGLRLDSRTRALLAAAPAAEDRDDGHDDDDEPDSPAPMQPFVPQHRRVGVKRQRDEPAPQEPLLDIDADVDATFALLS